MNDLKNQYLHLLFNEPLYLIQEQQKDPVSELKEHIEADEMKADSQESVDEINYQGENQKQIVILLSSEKALFKDKNEEALLKNILKSVNLTFKDVALLNPQHIPKNIDIEILTSKIDVNFLISFGVSPELLFPNRTVVNHEVMQRNNIKVLFTYGLDELHDNRDKKISLWNNLKKLFL